MIIRPSDNLGITESNSITRVCSNIYYTASLFIAMKKAFSIVYI